MGSAVREWDEYAENWDTEPATRAYASAAFSSLQDVVSSAHLNLDHARVVDFGCGTGLLTEHLVAAGAEVFAIDTSPAMLEVLQTKIDRRQWTGVRTNTSLPVETASFDLVVCSSVCAFLDDYPATVNALVATLRHGGLFVQWDWERQGEGPHGLSRSDIHDALQNAGLVDISVHEAFKITIDDQAMFPIMGVGQRVRR